jgi:hypothetical protein
LAAVVAGRVERPQYGWSEFPSVIRRAALDIELAERANRQQESDVRDAVICTICGDDPLGLVRVFNPWWVDDCGSKIGECQDKTMLRNCWRRWHVTSERNKGGMHLPAICSCASQIASRRRREFEKRTFNAVGIYSANFCRWVDGSASESIEQFRKWRADREDVTKHEGYVQEFDAWK